MSQSAPLTSSAALMRPQQSARRRRLEALGRWSFIMPVLGLNLIVVVIPTIYSFYIAFTNWSGYGAPEFAGLKNFQELFQDRIFFKALGNNLTWTLIFLTVPVI